VSLTVIISSYFVQKQQFFLVFWKQTNSSTFACHVCDVAQNIRKSIEKLGEQDVLLAPPIILLGEHLLSLLPPVPAPMVTSAAGDRGIMRI